MDMLQYATGFFLMMFLTTKSGKAFRGHMQQGNQLTKAETEARDFVLYWGEKIEDNEHDYLNALWKYELNRTEKNFKKVEKYEKKLRKARMKGWKKIREFKGRSINSHDINWMLEVLNITGMEEIPEDLQARYYKLLDIMKSHYNSVKIRKYSPHTINVYITYKEMIQICDLTENEEELRHYFVQWYDSFDLHIRETYTEYMELVKEISKQNYALSPVHYWNRDFGKIDIAFISYALQRKVKNLYMHLHAYVRYHLNKKYGSKVVHLKGAIPVHLFGGDFQGGSWRKLFTESMPYKDRQFFTYTDYLNNKNYTVKDLAQLADDFYQSMQLIELPKKFYKKSILDKSQAPNSTFDCTPSLWDFQDERDFRLRMCGEVSEEGLKVLYRQMGHLQYMLHYQRLPYVYRKPANLAFSEAIGQLPLLTIFSPRYLYKKKFINFVPKKEDRINYLYWLALEIVPFVSYSYTMERWRWDVLNGTVTSRNYGHGLWRRRLAFSGIKAPTLRTEKTFDVGTRYEIISGEQYLKKFLGTIVSFQLHEAFCRRTKYHKNYGSKEESYLHKCSLYGNKEVGEILSSLMEYGISRPWYYTANKFFGNKRIDSDPLIDFFKPLESWLVKQNLKNKVYVGWRM